MREKRCILVLACMVIFLVFLSCAWRQNDRCWISNARYEEAKQLYMETNSLDLVRQKLEDRHWSIAERNEAEYRLIKEFHLEQDSQFSTE